MFSRPPARDRAGTCAAPAEPALLPGHPLCWSLTPPQGRRCPAELGPAWREGTEGTGQGGRGEGSAQVELSGGARGAPGVGALVGVGLGSGSGWRWDWDWDCGGAGIAAGPAPAPGRLRRLQPRNRKSFRCSGVPCVAAEAPRPVLGVGSSVTGHGAARNWGSCARPRCFKRFPCIGKYLRLF